jgi:hypothetical protein
MTPVRPATFPFTARPQAHLQPHAPLQSVQANLWCAGFPQTHTTGAKQMLWDFLKWFVVHLHRLLRWGISSEKNEADLGALKLPWVVSSLGVG